MAKLGRPTLYTPELAKEICLRLAEGEPLDSICRDDHMPAPSTVRLWVVGDREGFSAEHARAREAQGWSFVDRISDIMERLLANEIGSDTARVLIQGLERQAALVSPKFSQRRVHEHSGPSGGAVEVELKDARQKVADRLAGMAERSTADTDG